MTLPRPGIDVQMPSDFSGIDGLYEQMNVARVKKYIEALMRKGMRGFVGKPFSKESRDVFMSTVADVYNHVLKLGVLEEGWSIYAEEDFDDAGSVKVKLLPPSPRKELPPARHNSSVGMAVANMQGVTHLAKETKGAEMNKVEILKKISERTGTVADRLVLEQCRPGVLSVDVLHGTDIERWAAAAALKALVPAAVATKTHARETADNKCCGYKGSDGVACGHRLKVVETRFSGRVQAKSRCSNPLCPNGKHWMPLYRPATTARPSATVALVVDHGYDEPGSWGPKPKTLTEFLCETQPLSRLPHWPWPVDPPGKTEPLSKPVENRCAYTGWVPKVGDHVRAWNGGLWGHIEDVELTKGAGENIFLIRIYKANSSGIAAGATAELTLAELLRGWKLVDEAEEKPRWTPTVGARIVNQLSGQEYYIVGTSGYGKKFELMTTYGTCFTHDFKTVFSDYKPYTDWYPKVNMWVRSLSTHRTGCINRMIDPHGNWLVQFTDQLGPSDVADEYMLQHFCEAPAPKATPHWHDLERGSNAIKKIAKEHNLDICTLKEPAPTEKPLELIPGMSVRDKYHGHTGVLVERKVSDFIGVTWRVRWSGNIESDISEGTLLRLFETTKRIGTCTGRVSSEHPNEASAPSSDPDIYARLQEYCGSRLGAKNALFGAMYGRDPALLLKEHCGLDPWSPGFLKASAELKKLVNKAEWPTKRLDSSWVGREIIHRFTGDVCRLGHEHADGWDVASLGSTFRMPEQLVFEAFYPAPR